MGRTWTGRADQARAMKVEAVKWGHRDVREQKLPGAVGDRPWWGARCSAARRRRPLHQSPRAGRAGGGFGALVKGSQ